MDETGYKRLNRNKKMTIITAQGGAYPEGSSTHAYDLQTPYLKLIFGFIGITNIDFVHADSLALGDDARNLAIANAQSALKTAVAQGLQSLRTKTDSLLGRIGWFLQIVVLYKAVRLCLGRICKVWM